MSTDITFDFDPQHQKIFISVAKLAGVHSFLMCGVYEENDSGTKAVKLLCRVGKQFARGNSVCGNFKALFNLLFSSTKSNVYDEGVYWRGETGASESQTITYHAYDITFEQYLEFIYLLQQLEVQSNTDKSRYFYYKPEAMTSEDDKKIRLRLTEKKLPDAKNIKNIEQIKSSVSNISLNNTCRHSAIKLVEHAKGSPVSARVSPHFFNNLTCSSVLHKAALSSEIPFYVLPAPPVAVVNKSAQELLVLKALYKRMEDLLVLAPVASETQVKFKLLKEFYLKTLGLQKECSVIELLGNLQEWKNTHHTELSTLRKTYFWDSLGLVKRECKTMLMINELENQVSSYCAN